MKIVLRPIGILVLTIQKRVIILAFLIMWGNKTEVGIILATFLSLTYTIMLLKTTNEKANRHLPNLIILSIPFPYLVQF